MTFWWASFDDRDSACLSGQSLESAELTAADQAGLRWVGQTTDPLHLPGHGLPEDSFLYVLRIR